MKLCATGFGAARIWNDETYRGTWERSRQSQHHPRTPPTPRVIVGRGSLSTGSKSDACGENWAFQTRPMTCRLAWLAPGRRVPVKTTGPICAGLDSFTDLPPPRTPRRWLKRSCSSFSNWDIAQLHSVERYQPLKLSDCWDGSRTWVGTDFGVSQKHQWLPKANGPMQARTSCKPWRRHAAPLPTGPSLPRPPFHLRASQGWGKSPPSVAQDCVLVQSRTRGSKETNGGSPGTWGVTLRSGSPGSGRRTWVVKSLSSSYLEEGLARLL